MSCPICKNTKGFVCGTCIDCGFNSIDNEFQFIEVNTKILSHYLPSELLDRLIEEHYNQKKNMHSLI